jgi:hypothetical protein
VLAGIVGNGNCPPHWLGVAEIIACQLDGMPENDDDLWRFASELRQMPHEQIHALLWAVQWAVSVGANIEKDEWWTLEYRERWINKGRKPQKRDIASNEKEGVPNEDRSGNPQAP